MTNGTSDFLRLARELFHTECARPASVLIDGNLMTMRLNRGRAVEGVSASTGRRLPRNRFEGGDDVTSIRRVQVAWEIKRVFIVLPTRRVVIDRSASFSRRKATLFFHSRCPPLPR